jgi:hypothetical protein
MNRLLRNASDLFVPAHNFATLKRFPLFTFPRLWNDEEENVILQTHKIVFTCKYCRLFSIYVPFTCYPHLPHPPPPLLPPQSKELVRGPPELVQHFRL